MYKNLFGNSSTYDMIYFNEKKIRNYIYMYVYDQTIRIHIWEIKNT